MASNNHFINETTMMCSEVIFSKRAMLSVVAETAEHSNSETGGVFLGFVHHRSWYVVENLDPGPHSVFTPSYFEYDREYISHLANKIARYYERRLSLIGLWHKHPGSLDRFSSTDDATNLRYATLIPEGAISCIINVDPMFRITPYYVSLPLCYRQVPFRVGDTFFPSNSLEYRKDMVGLSLTPAFAASVRTPDSAGETHWTEDSGEPSAQPTSLHQARAEQVVVGPQVESASAAREGGLARRLGASVWKALNAVAPSGHPQSDIERTRADSRQTASASSRPERADVSAVQMPPVIPIPAADPPAVDYEPHVAQPDGSAALLDDLLSMLDIEAEYLEQHRTPYEIHPLGPSCALLKVDIGPLSSLRIGEMHITISFRVSAGQRSFRVGGRELPHRGTSVVRELLEANQVDLLSNRKRYIQ